MREIYENGPVVLNLLSVGDLYSYESGVYFPAFDEQYLEVELTYFF